MVGQPGCFVQSYARFQQISGVLGDAVLPAVGIVRQQFDGAVQVFQDEAGHLMTGLPLAGGHQRFHLVRKGLRDDGEVAQGAQLVEVGLGTQEIDLADVVIHRFVLHITVLHVRHGYFKEIVQVADLLEVPRVTAAVRFGGPPFARQPLIAVTGRYLVVSTVVRPQEVGAPTAGSSEVVMSHGIGGIVAHAIEEGLGRHRIQRLHVEEIVAGRERRQPACQYK